MGMHTVAPATDFAVHRPDHQGVAPAGFERVHIGQRTLQVCRLAGLKQALAHLCSGDRGKWCHLIAVAVPPKRGVGNVKHLVGVERDRDVVDACAVLAQPLGHALHVGVGAGHWQCRA